MTFIKKTKQIPVQGPYKNLDPIKVSMQGIRRLILKYRTAAQRSTNPDYVIPQEEKIEKLSLILADLNLIIHQR